MLGRLMLLKLTLDQRSRIGTRADQVFLGIVPFVLIEFKLGLRDIQLLLDADLVWTVRAGQFFLQLLHPLLIGLDFARDFPSVLIQFAELRLCLWWMIRCFSGGIVEGEVYFIVGEPHGFR